MTTARRSIHLVTMVATLCFVGPVTAEVSTDPQYGDFSTTLIMGIIEHADPIPQVSWQPFRPLPTERILNPDGDARGDGPPDVAWHPITGWPAVVWAYNAGTDHDIAFAEWTGGAWSAVDFLTAGVEDELDPRLFVEPDGTVHVTWWTPATVQVWWAVRPAGSAAWNAPEFVTVGRRPSVALFEGIVQVAFERDSTEPGMAQDVAVARREGSATWPSSLVASTTRAERLDATLHVALARLWVDWKHGAAALACAEYVQPTWTGLETHAWPDLSWVGSAEVRQEIRRAVLGY